LAAFSFTKVFDDYRPFPVLTALVLGKPHRLIVKMDFQNGIPVFRLKEDYLTSF
jgi:hypothetical protein